MSTMQRDEVCRLLDQVTLEVLLLSECRVRAQLTLEDGMTRALLLLAKSRYLMGQSSVSALQLPTEHSMEFNALSTIETSTVEDSLCPREYSVSCNSSSDQSNPVKWFGVLVPQSLHQARQMFTRTLHWMVGGLNVGSRLGEALRVRASLMHIKQKLTPEE